MSPAVGGGGGDKTILAVFCQGVMQAEDAISMKCYYRASVKEDICVQHGSCKLDF